MPDHSPAVSRRGPGSRLALSDFLAARLTEDLARLWDRDRDRSHVVSRPALAAQVAIIDELLVTLRSGRLPATPDLRILLHGYGRHPDYDATWTRELDRPT